MDEEGKKGEAGGAVKCMYHDFLSRLARFMCSCAPPVFVFGIM